MFLLTMSMSQLLIVLMEISSATSWVSIYSHLIDANESLSFEGTLCKCKLGFKVYGSGSRPASRRP